MMTMMVMMIKAPTPGNLPVFSSQRVDDVCLRQVRSITIIGTSLTLLLLMMTAMLGCGPETVKTSTCLRDD